MFPSVIFITILVKVIAAKTIEIRQKYKTKLPDAIIAATALVHNLTIISRNTADFKNIEGLKVLDLYNL